MFTETIVSVFIIGFLAGVAFMQLTAVRNLERQTRRMTSERRRETRQAVYRQQAREHRGTPYRPRTVVEWAESLPWHEDNSVWSRKAQPDNVTHIGATR